MYKRQNEYKYNLESLKQESTRFLYKLRIATKLKNTREDNVNAQPLNGQIKGCTNEAGNEALGYKGSRIQIVQNGIRKR